MRVESKQLERTMENRHEFVNDFDSNDKSSNDSANSTEHSNHIEGYLFKRTSKGFKTWNRRWFYLCDNQLVYKLVGIIFFFKKRNKI